MIDSLNKEPDILAQITAPSDRPRVIVAQLGARLHYAVPRILEQSGLLDTLYTDLYAGAGWPGRVNRCFPDFMRVGPVRRMFGRSVDLPPERVRQFPVFGLLRQFRKIGRNTPSGTRQVQLSANRRFGTLVASQQWGNATAVYVYNGAGLEILNQARNRGCRTILEQTSAPVEFEEQLAREERECWPGWESGGTPESIWRPFADRERAEWKLADKVICGSAHIQRLLQSEVPSHSSVTMVPYGIDPSRFASRIRKPAKRPLRVLFVGHLRLLKGVQYLAAAIGLLNSNGIEAKMVGQCKLSALGRKHLGGCAELTGPVPRNVVREQYDWADVLVLPTLSEGSAAVCYEALASGLPVITTPHAGSVVRDSIDGFIVPIRSCEALADRLAKLEDDRELLAQLSENALLRSSEFTIAGYASRLVPAIHQAAP